MNVCTKFDGKQFSKCLDSSLRTTNVNVIVSNIITILGNITGNSSSGEHECLYEMYNITPIQKLNLLDNLIFSSYHQPCCLFCLLFIGPLQALPRRRVSVAVVPKFNLLNIPGQTPATAGPGPNLASGPIPSSGPILASGPNVGPTTGAALPVLVSLPVLSGNYGK